MQRYDINVGDHFGEWVAVVDGEVISSGIDAKKVYQDAKEKYVDKIPFIMKIPKEITILL